MLPTRRPAPNLRNAVTSMGMAYRDIEAFTGSEDHANRLIEWKAGSITVLRHYKLGQQTRGARMQRQFTIELRVDFADSEKLGPLKQVLQQAARHAFATAQLISDNPKSTQIAIFSDDFFSGHEEIKLLEDTIQQGLDQIGEDSGTEGISSELLAAGSGT